MERETLKHYIMYCYNKRKQLYMNRTCYRHMTLHYELHLNSRMTLYHAKSTLFQNCISFHTIHIYSINKNRLDIERRYQRKLINIRNRDIMKDIWS